MHCSVEHVLYRSNTFSYKDSPRDELQVNNLTLTMKGMYNIVGMSLSKHRRAGLLGSLHYHTPIKTVMSVTRMNCSSQTSFVTGMIHPRAHKNG